MRIITGFSLGHLPYTLPPPKFTWIECIVGVLAIIFLVVWTMYWYKKSRR